MQINFKLNACNVTYYEQIVRFPMRIMVHVTNRLIVLINFQKNIFF